MPKTLTTCGELLEVLLKRAQSHGVPLAMTDMSMDALVHIGRGSHHDFWLFGLCMDFWTAQGLAQQVFIRPDHAKRQIQITTQDRLLYGYRVNVTLPMIDDDEIDLDGDL